MRKYGRIFGINVHPTDIFRFDICDSREKDKWYILGLGFTGVLQSIFWTFVGNGCINWNSYFDQY